MSIEIRNFFSEKQIDQVLKSASSAWEHNKMPKIKEFAAQITNKSSRHRTAEQSGK